ncbi:MAG TPA: hypothetical protein VH833_12295 [Gemmatimonadales bacterium]
MRSYLPLAGLGAVLVGVALWLGGPGAGIGGATALAAQTAAVALLRPVMQAPQPVFMARWFSGMGIRTLALGILIVISATHRAALPLLETALGFLGVLLPLLFLEIRFLK